MAFIEHVNLTVRDPDAAAALFARLFGWREPSALGGRTIHVGDDRGYVALWTPDRPPEPSPKGRPLNHVELVVDDLDAVEARVAAEGLTPFSHGDYAPGRRFYFLDPDGIEWELVSYADGNA